jgi:hypothetical protein
MYKYIYLYVSIYKIILSPVILYFVLTAPVCVSGPVFNVGGRHGVSGFLYGGGGGAGAGKQGPQLTYSVREIARQRARNARNGWVHTRTMQQTLDDEAIAYYTYSCIFEALAYVFLYVYSTAEQCPLLINTVRRIACQRRRAKTNMPWHVLASSIEQTLSDEYLRVVV